MIIIEIRYLRDFDLPRATGEGDLLYFRTNQTRYYNNSSDIIPVDRCFKQFTPNSSEKKKTKQNKI